MKLTLKEKIAVHVRKEKEKRQESKRKVYKERYNKVKKYKFPPKEHINTNKHFYFFKLLVSDYNLSKSALAVYPVLCLKADFKDDNWFQMPQEEISVKAGLSINTVQKALVELENNELLERKKRNEGKRHYYLYKVLFIRKDMITDYEKEYFTFNQSIIDSGVWSKLNPRSKVLYLAMRVKAQFDFESIFDDVPFDGTRIDYDDLIKSYLEDFRNRKYDICELPLSQLCGFASINQTNLKPVISQLERYRLVKSYGDYFEVYLIPKI